MSKDIKGIASWLFANRLTLDVVKTFYGYKRKTNSSELGRGYYSFSVRYRIGESKLLLIALA